MGSRNDRLLRDRSAMTESDLAIHSEQAKRRPKCCRRLANQYRELAENYRKHQDRFQEAEDTATAIALLYEHAAKEAGTWEIEEECE